LEGKKYSYSLVTTVFNRINEFKYLVDSFWEQESCEDVEFVVVDDGSNDGSWEFICECAEKDERIKNIFIPAEEKIQHFCRMWDYIGNVAPQSKSHKLYEIAMRRMDDCKKGEKFLGINDAHPINVGMAAATGDVLIKIAGDYCISRQKKLIDVFGAYGAVNRPFVTVQIVEPRRNVVNESPFPLHGLLATQKETYWRIGGYDERILCRAWHGDHFLSVSRRNTYSDLIECALWCKNVSWVLKEKWIDMYGKDEGLRRYTKLKQEQQKEVWYWPQFEHSQVCDIFKEWLSSYEPVNQIEEEEMRLCWKREVMNNSSDFPHIPQNLFCMDIDWLAGQEREDEKKSKKYEHIKRFEDIYQKKGPYHELAAGFTYWFLQDNYRTIAQYCKKSDIVLDLACGEGCLSRHLDVQKLVGLDHSPKAMELNAELYPGVYDDLFLSDMRTLGAIKFPVDSFSVVICSLSLMYLIGEDVDNCLQNVYNLLNGNDRFLITYPAQNEYRKASSEADELEFDELKRKLQMRKFEVNRVIPICPVMSKELVEVSESLEHDGSVYREYEEKKKMMNMDNCYHYFMECIKQTRE